MPVAAASPARNRRSRTPAVKIAATVTTAGVATVASGALDRFQNGDICTIVDAVNGTKYTGQATNPVDALYSIQKLSATTAQLVTLSTGVALAAGVAISAGAALQFGDPDTDVAGLAPNIVASGSVAGGGFGGPLD